MRRRWPIALCGGLLAAGVLLFLDRDVSSDASNSPPLSVAEERAPVVEESSVGIPNIALTTHDGRKVRFYDDLIKDKMVLITFMYTTCDGI